MSPPINPTGKRLALRNLPLSAFIFLGVFVLRLVVLVRLTDSQFLLPHAGDMRFYNDWALRILRGEWTTHLAFYGLPLYAYLLATFYKIAGYSPFIPGLLQAALEGGTAVLLYKISGAVFGPTKERETSSFRAKTIGLLAAVGWAFFQPAEAYSVILMPTSWLIFVFWFVVWEIVRAQRSPTIFRIFLLGGLIGFTAMGIATVLFLVPLVIAALLFRWRAPPAICRASASLAAVEPRQAERPTYKVTAVTLLLIGVCVGASPAWIHNYFIARDPVFLSAHSGVNFWVGNNPMANGYPKFPPGLHASQEAMLHDSITAAEKSAGRPLKRSEVSAYWSQKAGAWIRNHPLAWVELLGTKIKNFWNAFQYDDLSIIETLREEGVTFPGIRFGIIAALSLPGLLLTWRKFPLSRWITAAILLHLLSLLSVFVTERYRMAAVPGLLLFAAAAIWEFWSAGMSANYRGAALYLTLLILSAWFVSIPQREPSLWALESYNSGLRALQSNKLAIAEEKLDLAYAYVPENAELNFALGNLRLAQGRPNAAKGFYFATLRLDPLHEGSYNNLGILALEEKRWKLAGEFFSRALEQSPEDAKTHYLSALVHFKSGDVKGARKEIAEALNHNPKQAEFIALQNQISRIAAESQ